MSRQTPEYRYAHWLLPGHALAETKTFYIGVTGREGVFADGEQYVRSLWAKVAPGSAAHWPSAPIWLTFSDLGTSRELAFVYAPPARIAVLFEDGYNGCPRYFVLDRQPRSEFFGRLLEWIWSDTFEDYGPLDSSDNDEFLRRVNDLLATTPAPAEAREDARKRRNAAAEARNRELFARALPGAVMPDPTCRARMRVLLETPESLPARLSERHLSHLLGLPMKQVRSLAESGQFGASRGLFGYKFSRDKLLDLFRSVFNIAQSDG